MFVTISPFLVIDDNTINASIIFAKIDKFNRLIPIETAYTCLDAYHHPMMTWPPPKTMISPFVPPPILLLLPHDLISLGVSPPLGYTFFSLRKYLALIHISPPLESNHLKGLVP